MSGSTLRRVHKQMMDVDKIIGNKPDDLAATAKICYKDLFSIIRAYFAFYTYDDITSSHPSIIGETTAAQKLITAYANRRRLIKAAVSTMGYIGGINAVNEMTNRNLIQLANLKSKHCRPAVPNISKHYIMPMSRISRLPWIQPLKKITIAN